MGVFNNTTDGFLSGNLTNATSAAELNSSMAPEVDSSDEVILASEILDRITAGITVIGLLANSCSLATLLRKPRGFSPAILFLLRIQSFLDAVACLFTTTLILAPEDLLSGIGWLDVILCYGWHSHAFFWGWILMSILNLINIAIDRYRCVCSPLEYYQTDIRRWYCGITALPILSFVFSSGSYFQTRLVDGVCLHIYRWDGELMKNIMFGFSATTVFTFYVIPVTLFIVLYGRVIYTMRRRCGDPNTNASRTMNKAATEITKTAIVVTVIFIFTLGYDSIYYFLGYAGWVPYIQNTPIQRVGVLLAGLNNFANPFVYVALMPTYKRNVLAMWLPCWGKQKKEDRNKSKSGSSTSNTNTRSFTISKESLNTTEGPSQSTETINTI